MKKISLTNGSFDNIIDQLLEKQIVKESSTIKDSNINNNIQYKPEPYNPYHSKNVKSLDIDSLENLLQPFNDGLFYNNAPSPAIFKKEGNQQNINIQDNDAIKNNGNGDDKENIKYVKSKRCTIF